MTWTAILKDAKDRKDYWKITVEFTDGTRTAERAYRWSGSTAQQLASFVRGKAQEFEQSDNIDLTTYIEQSIDVTPPTPTPPTQAEIDRRDWLDDWRELSAILRVIEAVPALDTAQVQTRITQLRNALDSGWQNSYLDYV